MRGLSKAIRTKRVRIGNEGSADRLICRINDWGFYLSLRPLGDRRFRLAFGPHYRFTLHIR